MSDDDAIDGFKKNTCVKISLDAWCCKGRLGRVWRVRSPSEGRPIIVAVANEEGTEPSGAIIAFDSDELDKTPCRADWPIPKFP